MSRSPLQEFKKRNVERWSVLQDIPQWEMESILTWLREIFMHTDNSGMYSKDIFHYNIIRAIETENRIMVEDDLGIGTDSWSGMKTSIFRLIESGDINKLVLFIECVVKYVRESSYKLRYYGSDVENEIILHDLEIFLSRGSKWRVIYDKGVEAGLIERVNDNLTQIAKSLESDYLTKAWNEAFSVTPNPERAIEYAQRAVEMIASEKGLTLDKTSVYGKLIGDIRAHPENYVSAANGAYSLAEKLSKDPNNPTSINVQFSNWFWMGMDLIQKTHPTRHVSDETKDFVLSPEAGKQATLIATLICQLIEVGYLTKLSKK